MSTHEETEKLAYWYWEQWTRAKWAQRRMMTLLENPGPQFFWFMAERALGRERNIDIR